MTWRTYLRLLTALTLTGISAIAQTSQSPPQIVGDLPSIPVEESQQHLVEHEPPVYPPLAKLAKIEGDVRLRLQIDSNGAVVSVVPVSGNPLLVQAAIDAAKKYRYKPFELSGLPGGVLANAVVTFSLSSLSVPTRPTPFPEITNLGSVVMEYDDGWIHVRVSGTGAVEYSGNQFVVVEGKHQSRIDAAEVQTLIDAFRKADFFSLQDDYSISASDVGSQSTSIQIGSVRKTLASNINIPPVLKSVQEAILKFSHSEQWVTGNNQTVPGLLAESSDPSANRDNLSSVLPRAALYGDLSLVREILANRVDLEYHGPYHATALMLAADRGLPDMVGVLLQAGANPHAVDWDGRGALIFGAGSGNAEVLRLLLGAGLSGNAKDKCGDTALMAAAASGNPDTVQLLLRRGAKVNARNKRRQSALLSAATGDTGFCIDDYGREHAEVPKAQVHRDIVVKLLLDAGADINARGWDGETALFTLEDDAIEELIRHHINLELRNRYNETALVETVSGSVADLLIKAGADVNSRGHEGETPLIMAAANNELDKLEVLIKAKGIRLEERDDKGNTALMKAKAAHLEDAVRMLVAAGATE
jgi:TonB family protein